MIIYGVRRLPPPALPHRIALRKGCARLSGKEFFQDHFREFVSGLGAIRRGKEIGEHYNRGALAWQVAHEALEARKLAVVTEKPIDIKNGQPVLERCWRRP